MIAALARIGSRRCASLLLAIGLLTGAGLSGADEDPPKPQKDEVFGAEADPSGEPTGGGAGYSAILPRRGKIVRTAKALLAALKKARAGDVVYVHDDAEIDLTGKRDIIIPGGVTLASGRGHMGSKGGLLFSNEDKHTPGKASERFHLFATGGPGVRMSGLRLRGPDPHQRDRYEYLNSDGLLIDHSKAVVDNCELWAWSHGAVYVKKGGDGAHVHHNDIHHTQRKGLGYGVVLDAAFVLIECNVFDYYRHAIAGTGRPGSGYEARYNIVGVHTISHAFDMHGPRDAAGRRGEADFAGDTILIHHNTFRHARRHAAVVIRGDPEKKAEIHHNWFWMENPKKAVRQTVGRLRMRTWRNQYGVSRTIKD